MPRNIIMVCLVALVGGIGSHPIYSTNIVTLLKKAISPCVIIQCYDENKHRLRPRGEGRRDGDIVEKIYYIPYLFLKEDEGGRLREERREGRCWTRKLL